MVNSGSPIQDLSPQEFPRDNSVCHVLPSTQAQQVVQGQSLAGRLGSVV